MNEAVSPISRRELLTPWRAPERTDQRLAGAIESELGLTQKHVGFYMVTGNHVLTPEHVTRIEKDQINVITGEFDQQTLNAIINSPYPVEDLYPEADIASILHRLKHSGEGSSTEELRYNAREIRNLLKNGKTFVSSDDFPYQSSFDSSRPAELRSLREAGLIAGLVGGSAAYGIRRISHRSSVTKESTRRAFLKKGIAASAAAFGSHRLGNWIDSAKASRNTPLTDLPFPFNNQPIQEEIQYEEMRQRFGIDKHAFEVYKKVKIDLRNQIMALNAWHTVAQSAPTLDGTKVNIMMTFGGSHNEIYEEFTRGPLALEVELGSYATKLCTNSLDFLINEADRAKKETPDCKDNEERVISDLCGYADMFVDPYHFGKSQPLDKPLVTRMPKTARAVFIEKLSKAILENEQVGTKEGQRRAVILRAVKTRLVSDLLVGLNANEETNQKIQESTDMQVVSADNADRAGIIATFSSNYSEDIKQAEDEVSKTRTEKTIFQQGITGMGVYLGITFYHGRYHPVIRDFTVRPDGVVEAVDYLRLASNHRLQLGKTFYKKAQDLYPPNYWFKSDTVRTLELDHNPSLWAYLIEMQVRPNNGRLQGFPEGCLVTKDIDKNFGTNQVKQSHYYAKVGDGKDDLLPTDLLLLTTVHSKN